MKRLSGFCLLLFILSACSTSAPAVETVYIQGVKVIWNDIAPPVNYTFDLDGKRNRSVPIPRQVKDAFMAEWSPDGQWIAFSNIEDEFESDPYRNLYLMDAQGENVYPVVVEPEAGDVFGSPLSVSDPSWSPDGKSIAFDVSRGNAHESTLQIVQVDCIVQGISCSTATKQNIPGQHPRWSPDGRTIAYSIFDEKKDGYVIYTAPVKDLRSRKKITLPELSCRTVDWSPAGNQIVAACKDHKLYIFNLNDLSHEDLPITGIQPRWSSDGKKIVFISIDWEGVGESIGLLSTCTSNAVFTLEVETMKIQRITQSSNECLSWFTLVSPNQ